MKFLRGLFAVLAVLLFNVFFGFLTCGWLFKWVYFIEPAYAWRDMSSINPYFWLAVAIGQLVVSTVYVLVYFWIGRIIPGNRFSKGVLYGLLIWFVSMIPGMIMTYLFMNVSWQAVVYMALRSLVGFPIMGLIIAGICPKKTL